MLTLADQARLIASGEASPVDLCAQALERAESVQPHLNAFTHVLAEQALERARELAGQPPRGPLHGIPVAVKDLYDVAGVETTGCCAAYQRLPRRNAAVVARLLEAGAVVIAKTNQHELAVGATNRASSFGPAWNPWKPGHTPGGSSGGSGAAVASGAVGLAMGSDTAGSVRIPASFCGVTGLKPTHGSVSMSGAMPLAPSMDTAGPLVRDVGDCALVHRVLAGFDPDDLWSQDGRPADPPGHLRLRVSIPTRWMELVHPQVRAAVRAAADALEAMGCILDEVEGPDPSQAAACGYVLMFAQFANHYRGIIDDDRVGEEAARLLRFGLGLTGPDVAAALHEARHVTRRLEWSLTLADVLLAPATPYPAPPMDADQVEIEGGTLDVHMGGPARLTLPANVAGFPALSLPIGTTDDGLPIGGQLIGRPWSEEVLFAVGLAYQQHTGWHRRLPPSQA